MVVRHALAVVGVVGVVAGYAMRHTVRHAVRHARPLLAVLVGVGGQPRGRQQQPAVLRRVRSHVMVVVVVVVHRSGRNAPPKRMSYGDWSWQYQSMPRPVRCGTEVRR